MSVTNFLNSVQQFLNLSYEVEQTKSSYTATANSDKGGGVSWDFDPMTGQYEFTSVELVNGKRVCRKGVGTTPKEAFESRKQIGK